MTDRVTRLAPSPTGTLHVGNIRTFLINWALARSQGWSIVMRIEDLDRQRVRPNADSALLDSLQWLGIDWDSRPVHQSHDLEPYRNAMRLLLADRRSYACSLTRKQIQTATSAPHLEDRELRYPPELRPPLQQPQTFDREDANYRLVVFDETITVDDQFAGVHTFSPFNEVGDFVIWTKLGVPAYQLAVVVDDARQGVTDVVRGDDLLTSAARQMLLYRALDLNPPRWWHLPLVQGHDGRRLAKRHGETHLDFYRTAGVRPERIIGLMAYWCGTLKSRDEISTSDFLQRFDIDTLSRRPVSFTEEDHRWLLGTC